MKKCVRPALGCFLIAAAVVLPACDRLVMPNRTAEMVELDGGQFELDPEHTTMLFKVEHLGISTYIGRFNDVAASLDFDPEAVEDTRLEAIVSPGSLDLADDDFEQTLREERGWFNAQEFPQAVFRSTGVENIADETFDLAGELTWRGVTRPVTLHVTVTGGGTNMLTGSYTLGFEAEGTLSRSSFGMDRFTDLVSDQVRLEIYGEFQRGGG